MTVSNRSTEVQWLIQRSPLVMVGLRFFQGVAVATVFAPSLALAGNLAGKGQSGSMLSILTMEFGLGIAFGTLFSGILIGFGFAVRFVVATIGGGVGLVLATMQVTETRDQAVGPHSVGD